MGRLKERIDRELHLLIDLVTEGGTKGYVRKEWLRRADHDDTAFTTFYRMRDRLPPEMHEQYRRLGDDRTFKPVLLQELRIYLEDRSEFPGDRQTVSIQSLLAYWEGLSDTSEWALKRYLGAMPRSLRSLVRD